jgi:hypothetical protein
MQMNNTTALIEELDLDMTVGCPGASLEILKVNCGLDMLAETQVESGRNLE